MKVWPHSLNGRVGGDRDRGPLVALGQDLEEELGTPPVEVEVAELVETEQVQAPVAADHLGQLPLVLGLDELVDEGCRGHVADPQAALAGGDPETDEQVRLAGPAVAEQDDGLARADPVAGRERREVPGAIEGVAPRSNSARRLIRGNRASAIRRSRRRPSRSSTSARGARRDRPGG